MDDFFAQWPTPIDTSQVDWDILGLKEVWIPSGKMVMKSFEIKKSLTISEIISRAKESGIIKEDESHIRSSGIEFIVDLKETIVRETIEEIRNLIVKEFSEDIKTLSGNVVQFVEKPLCFIDLTPGSTQISFKLITKRILGILDE